MCGNLTFDNISLDYKSVELTWLMTKHSAGSGYHTSNVAIFVKVVKDLILCVKLSSGNFYLFEL